MAGKISYVKSRGWRNNNPLNIRRGAKWVGLVKQPTDTEFCQFTTRMYGYRAAFRILRSYFNYFTQRNRPFTIETVISRWAPPTENATLQYISKVVQLTGIDREDPIGSPTTHYGQLRIAIIMGAMTVVETGCPWFAVPWPDIIDAVNRVCYVEARGEESIDIENLLYYTDIQKYFGHET